MSESFSAPFVAMFEALRMAPTFARGRRDARAGHVRQLTVSGSLITAQVRRPEESAAARARIAVRSFGAAEWARAEDGLVAEARFAADLLAGRMPAGIEAVFAAAGLNLLPLSLGEVAMDCTCEQWPRPCAHLAATVYAVAAAFDEDPFQVFAWRGRPREELLLRLRSLRATAAVETLHPPDGDDAPATDGDLGDPAGFWGVPPGGPMGAPRGAPPGAATGVPAGAPEPGPLRPGRPDALLDELDPPAVRIDGRPLTDVLRPAYRVLPVD